MKLVFTLIALAFVVLVLSACKSGPYTYISYTQAIASTKAVLLASPGLVDEPQCEEFINHGLWQAWEINGGWAITLDAILLNKVDNASSPSGFFYTVRPGNGDHIGWKFSRTKGLTQVEGVDSCALRGGSSFVYPPAVVTGT